MRYKWILLVGMLLTSGAGYAQRFYTKTGTTALKASVATFEPVEAENHSTTAILNTNNGEVAALLFIKAFHFEVALMEEHFNENYMDSERFPKATFKGGIKGFEEASLSSSDKEYTIIGDLEMKGKVQQVVSKAYLKKQDNTIFVTASFTVKPEDFDIEIPSIVRNKIATDTQISLHYELVEKK